jgi:hypothetical protein
VFVPGEPFQPNLMFVGKAPEPAPAPAIGRERIAKIVIILLLERLLS